MDLLKAPHHGHISSSSVAFLNAVTPELTVATGGYDIAFSIRNRYADCGITFLDDTTKGYVHVSADTTGMMVYENTRNDVAVDGGEMDPEEDEG